MSLCAGRTASALILTILSACCPQALGDHDGAGLCPELHAPSYSSLNFNGSDVTADQPAWDQDDVVEYQCANGYQLVNRSGAVVSNLTTICELDGNWTVEGDQVSCRVYDCGEPSTVRNGEATYTSTSYGAVATYRCRDGYSLDGGASTCTANGWTGTPRCDGLPKEPPLSNRQIVIIVSAVLGSFCLLLILVTLLMCCKMCSMHAKLTEGSVAEDEVAFARSQGIVAVNNPLMRKGMKEEDAAGNPLYLTPDELTDFEQQMAGTMTS